MLIYNAEGLDVKKFRKTTGSLWNYCRDELSNDTNDNKSKQKCNQLRSF